MTEQCNGIVGRFCPDPRRDVSAHRHAVAGALLVLVAVADALAVPVDQGPDAPMTIAPAPTLELPGGPALGTDVSGASDDLSDPIGSPLIRRSVLRGQDSWAATSDLETPDADAGEPSGPVVRDLLRALVNDGAPGGGLPAARGPGGGGGPGLVDLLLGTPVGSDALALVLDILQPTVDQHHRVRFSIFGYGDFAVERAVDGIVLVRGDAAPAPSLPRAPLPLAPFEPQVTAVQQPELMPVAQPARQVFDRPVTLPQFVVYLVRQVVDFLTHPFTLLVLLPSALAVLTLKVVLAKRRMRAAHRAQRAGRTRRTSRPSRRRARVPALS